MIEKAYEILKTYFGYKEFRYGQKELITNLINGTDCVGIMPTGAGKSSNFDGRNYVGNFSSDFFDERPSSCLIGSGHSRSIH